MKNPGIVIHDPMPRTCEDAVWLYERGRKMDAVNIDAVGKWLIFRDREEVNAAWAKIKLATASGLLGMASKVSTAIGAASHGGQHVICVYTRDCHDREDVMRVREALRGIGFVESLNYKTDEATRAGLYGKDAVFAYTA